MAKGECKVSNDDESSGDEHASNDDSDSDDDELIWITFLWWFC